MVILRRGGGGGGLMGEEERGKEGMGEGGGKGDRDIFEGISAPTLLKMCCRP